MYEIFVSSIPCGNSILLNFSNLRNFTYLWNYGNPNKFRRLIMSFFKNTLECCCSRKVEKWNKESRRNTTRYKLSKMPLYTLKNVRRKLFSYNHVLSWKILCYSGCLRNQNFLDLNKMLISPIIIKFEMKYIHTKEELVRKSFHFF